jgi:hypothetical protein
LKGKGAMSPEEADYLLKKQILPHQVWETLKTAEQQTVSQIIVRLCHQVAELWEKEEDDEPACDR